MRLTPLGTTGSMSGPSAAASAYLLQADRVEAGHRRTYSLLMDLGPGGFGALWRAMPPDDLHAIALSHLHIDHCGDLMSMQIFRRWNPRGPLAPLPLYAPDGAVARMRGLDGFAPDDDFAEFEYTPLRDGLAFEVGPMRVSAYPVWHTIPAFALRVEGPAEDGGRAVVTYSGDTDACDGLVAAARGADLFLCECGFTATDTARGIHLDGARAGRVATEAGVGTLLLTHIQPWTDPEVVRAETRATYRGRLDLAQAETTYRV